MCIVLGLDFGTDSVRVLAVEAKDGRCIAEASANYRRWAQGKYCEPSRQCYRQHPLDYIEAMTEAVRQVVAQLSASDVKRIRAIGVDATGSTVCAVDERALPLSMHEEFSEEPLAMFQIWKDLSASEAAEEINREIVRWRDETGVDYAALTGEYSAERFWAKALRSVRENPRIGERAFSWIELADWITNLLTGCRDAKKLYRCSCAASHKAMWSGKWDGLPDRALFERIDDRLAAVAENYGTPAPSTVCVGRISPEWADELGLNRDVLIAGCMLDAHAGAVGAGVNEHSVVAVLGTSTVQMTIAKAVNGAAKGICSVGEDSIIPGYFGLEAGQAAFGDVYAWLCRLAGWGILNLEDEALTPEVKKRLQEKMMGALTDALPPADAPMDLTALDWFNGRRHPNGNDGVRGAIAGISLGTDAPELFRCLIFATAFGSKRLLEGFEGLGVQVERVMAAGGIAKKSPYIMQVLADVFGKPVHVLETAQACALGACMAASVVCGVHSDLSSAQLAMESAVHKVYQPDAMRTVLFEKRYQDYLKLGDFMDKYK